MGEQAPDEDLMTVVVGDQEPAPPAPEPAEPAEPPQWPVDDVCAAAVELARETLVAEFPQDQVGEHQGLIADGPMVVTHFFAADVPGYAGWHWAVTLTRAPDSDLVTVDETSLLPSDGALLAPAWVPWRQRIQSGDLGVGDVMVTDAEDVRLVPGMSDNDVVEEDEDLRPQQWELGLGRVRMLSPEGRMQAAQRWYRETGPRAQIARGVDLECRTCGFLLLIGGPLGQAFGVCANGFSPVDGRIVAMNFGCGAHSETPETAVNDLPDAVIDELGYDDVVDVPEPEEPESPEEPGKAEASDETESTPETEDDQLQPADESQPDGEQQESEASPE